ncbi:hypothetical protein BT93_L1711 [Corymbia citriodora subsp. variegata]|uniref:DUF4283 domain-containing protein n=1 Tax=Corymbia citriodora subsp. variegata TaxID=360336 RepID=A0A8T0CR40_CORYI|nr:hypothetical protein BT93_L1711 [Corymbia citriodora subsp. variegata]
MLELRKGIYTSVPVWIRLKNLPYVLWSAPGLSVVASLVGKPLYVDQRMEQLKMISFARVYVELAATKDCCDSLRVVLNREACMVEVEYEWKPVSCKTCGTFGHECPVKNNTPTHEERINTSVVLHVPMESAAAMEVIVGVAAVETVMAS